MAANSGVHHPPFRPSDGLVIGLRGGGARRLCRPGARLSTSPSRAPRPAVCKCSGTP